MSTNARFEKKKNKKEVELIWKWRKSFPQMPKSFQEMQRYNTEFQATNKHSLSEWGECLIGVWEIISLNPVGDFPLSPWNEDSFNYKLAIVLYSSP